MMVDYLQADYMVMGQVRPLSMMNVGINVEKQTEREGKLKEYTTPKESF